MWDDHGKTDSAQRIPELSISLMHYSAHSGLEERKVLIVKEDFYWNNNAISTEKRYSQRVQHAHKPSLRAGLPWMVTQKSMQVASLHEVDCTQILAVDISENTFNMLAGGPESLRG